MTLAQKIGQMTQPEIKTATPEQVTQYYLGSVLNGGGSWPNENKHASAAEWVALADKYYDASMATDMATKVPVIWGIDAIHGNSNVLGATLFPHNIGLGAAHNAEADRAHRRRGRPGGARHRHQLGVRADAGRGARRSLGPHLRKLLGESGAGERIRRRLRARPAGQLQGPTPTSSPPPSTSSATAAPTRARTRASTRPPWRS